MSQSPRDSEKEKLLSYCIQSCDLYRQMRAIKRTKTSAIGNKCLMVIME